MARAGRIGHSFGTSKYLLAAIQVLTTLYTRSILGAHPLESLLKAGKHRR